MSIESQLAGMLRGLPDGVAEGVALGTGLADGYGLYESPLGTVAVTFNVEGVSSVDLADDEWKNRFVERFGRSVLRAEPPSAWGRYIEPAIDRGTPGKLPVDLRSVTPFQRNVLMVAATIPKGEVRPYGWIASEVERPGAARAVGSTMASNPVPLVVPCHRVVRADGHIGAYSLGGPHNKWELLEHEGANPGRLEELAAHHVRVEGNRSTGVYCYPTCRAIRRSKPDNVVDFSDADRARSDGFRACKICRPVG